MRVEIKNNSLRKLFFDSVKVELNERSWREIGKDFGISRTTLDKYRSGDYFMSEKFFTYFIGLLDTKVKKKIKKLKMFHQIKHRVTSV